MTLKGFFFSNDLKFGIFMYYAYVEFWKKIKKEFSFISLKQNMRKKIHFKIWFIKQFDMITLYSNFYNLCYNVKC